MAATASWIETLGRKFGVGGGGPLTGAPLSQIPSRCAQLTTAEVQTLFEDTRAEGERHAAARAEKDRTMRSITHEAVMRHAEDGGPPIGEPYQPALAAGTKLMAPWCDRAVREYGVSGGTPLDAVIGARLERLAEVLRERWAVEGEPKHVLAARKVLEQAAHLVITATREKKAAAEGLHLVRVVPQSLREEYGSGCRIVDAAQRQYEQALAALRATGASDEAPEPPAAA